MDWNKEREDEFKAILDRFSRMIGAHINKFNPQRFGLDPEDLAQDIRIKIWRLLDNEKEIGNLASYLKKIVNSSVIDKLRKWKREDGVLFVERQKKISETKRGYSAAFPLEEVLRESVAEAVDSLIESRRKVVRLYLLDLTIEEISALYNWSQDRTRNLLYRGLADLKRILRKKDIEYEDQF
jgi:RNA polymerase sigma-70 factor (ECF subfamily)